MSHKIPEYIIKIRIGFDDENDAEKPLMCKSISDKGWLTYEAMKLSHCYGVIKNVDTDLSDTDVLNNISYDGEITLAKRLNRRNRGDGGVSK